MDLFRNIWRKRSSRPSSQAPRARLEVEALESRLVPYSASGNAWIHPELITLSFVPDGTIVGSNANGPIYSNLFAAFDAKFGSSAVWQTQFLKAAQAWAQQTNINFVLVGDSGATIGSGDYQQGDPGMGDIRIGGYNFGTSTLAQAYMPPPVNNFSIAGDLQLNTGRPWNINTTYDMFTVAVHEIGHSLGLYHSATSPSAVMYASYNGIKQSLTNDDIAGIRAVYGGSRAPDVFDIVASNDGFATATPLTAQLDPTALTALVGNLDITTTSDSDYYTVLAPDTTSGTFTVTVQSSGLSLLSPTLTVFAADQTTVLASVGGPGQFGTTLTATLNNVVPGQQFFIKVAGSDNTAFSTGRYALTLNFGSGPNPTVTPPNTQTANGNPIQGGGGQAIKIDPEAQVNSTLSLLLTQETSTDNPQAVGMDANGNYVITWGSYLQDGNGWGVYARHYDAAGNALGNEFRVNNTTSGDQRYPVVAVATDGSFVIAWGSAKSNGNDWDVYARRYDATGNAVGNEFRVNTTTTGDQTNPVLGIDGSGNFVVIWTSRQNENSDWGVYGQRFSASGAALGGEFHVNNTTADDQTYQRVSMNDSGAFVVTWSSNNQDGSGWGVYARRYDASGNAVGNEFRVNTTTAGDQKRSSVAIDAAGDFFITWGSYGQDGSGWGIYAQRFDANGNAVGGEFRVNDTTAGDQRYASVVSDGAGNILVTWSSYGQDGSGWGVFARQFGAAGQAIGSEFQVNTTTLGDQRYSSVAVDNQGHAVIVWSGAGGLDAAGISSQRYAVNGANGLGNLGVGDDFADEGNSADATAAVTAGGSLVSTATVFLPVAGLAGAEQGISVAVARHLNPAPPTSLRGPDFVDGVFLAGFLTEAGRQAPSGGTRNEVTPVSWEMSASLVNGRESGTPADESGHTGSTSDSRAAAWGLAYDLVFAEVSWEEDALADPTVDSKEAAPRPGARETDQQAPSDPKGKEAPSGPNAKDQAQISATTDSSAEAEPVLAKAESFSPAPDDAPDEPES